ncbi:hypothetical protein KAR91_65570 [Candidatus Pacearchaeota archaeon]|nr:hypothetical protein [Candidatus Pacearchaeota archaeon]
MVIGDAVFGLVKGLVAPVSNYFMANQKRKAAKLTSDLKINEAKTDAKIDKIKTGQTADIAWEQTQIDKAGWKDDYWTIVLSIPAILCFVPGMVEHVRAGFDALGGMPGWYQWMLGIAVGAAFGYRKIADFMSLKKGN